MRSEIPYATQVRNFEEHYRAGGSNRATVHHRFVYQLVPKMKMRNIESVLDVGCGRGQVATELGALGFAVICTEIVPCLVANDLKKLAVYPYGIGELHYFDDASFDAVLLVNMLDHLRSEDEAVDAVRHASRLAHKLVMVTLGGWSEMRTIDYPASHWADFLRTHITSTSIDAGVDKSTRAHAWAFWK